MDDSIEAFAQALERRLQVFIDSEKDFLVTYSDSLSKINLSQGRVHGLLMAKEALIEMRKELKLRGFVNE